MLRYSDTITLPEEITLGVADTIDQFLTGLGWTNRKGRTLGFQMEAEDLWDLAMMMNEVEQELQSHGIDYIVDRANARLDGVQV